MKWNVSVGVMLSIDYDDIEAEAETEEEAKEIAKERAEDFDFNSASLDNLTVYCAYNGEEE